MTSTADAPIRLWPGPAPGSEDWTDDEESLTDPNTGMFIIRNVVVPTLTPVLPEPDPATGTAVVVAPGGAFAALAWHHEGTSTAAWFAERGIAAFVLKYRLARLPSDPAELIQRIGPMPDPTDGPAMRSWLRNGIGDAPDVATADGEQAIRLVRTRADEWGVDADRVGMIGFSAGGTVAAQTAATTHLEARPSFLVNMYGAFCEREIPADAPPFFGVVAADDTLCREPFLEVAQRWLEAGIPTEYHVYQSGGHGFGFTPQGTPIDSWPDRLHDWLAARGLLAGGVT